MFEVLDEGHFVSDRVAVLGRSHFSHDLRAEPCSCNDKILAQAGADKERGGWWNSFLKRAFVDGLLDGGLNGAKVEMGEPVDVWKWLKIETFVVLWEVDEAVEIEQVIGGFQVML